MRTDLTVILDRSGSMESIKNDAIGGLKSLIEDQKKLPGDINFSLVQFDTEIETLYNNVPIKDVGEITLVPRGGTALHDAMGQTINKIGDRLKNTVDKPDLVIVAVITDGEENSSREFRREQIKDMVEHQTNKYSWKFTFIGSNQDAITNGSNLGFNKESILLYANNKTFDAFVGFSNMTSGARCAAFEGREVDFAYSQKDILNSV